MKSSGFSLVEIIIVLLLASVLSLASCEWFLSIMRLYRAQQLLIENQEVGRFSLSYLNKSFSRAGAGLEKSEASLAFIEQGVMIRYRAELPFVGVSRNCLGNRSKSLFIEDRFVVANYEYGGKELKCLSSGRGDWLTEGIQDIQYEVVVDQGAFEGNVFIKGKYDGIPDAYVTQEQFDERTMKPMALRLFLSSYRPTKLTSHHLNYWAQEASDDQIQTDFTSLVLLPNS